MEVYINGMNMPAVDQGAITINIYADGVVTNYAGETIGEAVPIPPHGALIDRDKFRETMFIGEQCLYSWDEIEDAIDYAPTVIPAESEGE